MELQNIALVFFEVLSPVLAAVLVWLSAKLADLIRAKVHSEYLRALLIRLDDAVFTAVKSLQQTVVDQLKAATADGKLTEAEREQIKAAALANLKSYLGAKGIGELARILGIGDATVDSLLTSKLEAAVHDLRRTDPRLNGPSQEELTGPLAEAPTV